MSWRRWTLLALLCAAVAAFAVGCGDDDDDDGESAQAGTDTAADAGGEINVEPRDIGIVNLVRQSPAEDKIDRLYETMGEQLGWDIEIVDGAGDPQKIARAVQTMVNQGKDAIITTSTESAIIRQQLRAAQDRDIPVISTNGGTTPKGSLFTARYEEDEYRMGKELADQMKQDLGDDAKIANLKTALAVSGVLRDNALHDVFPRDKFTAEQDIDLTNPVVNTERVLNDILTAEPDTNAVHAVYDNMSQAAVTTIRRKRSDAKLYNYFTTEQNVKNLRADTALQAVADVNLPHTGAVAFDELLAYFENDDPIDEDALEKNPLTYKVITRDNVDEELGDKPEAFPNDEILQPFLEKWRDEYAAG